MQVHSIKKIVFLILNFLRIEFFFRFKFIYQNFESHKQSQIHYLWLTSNAINCEILAFVGKYTNVLLVILKQA